MPKLSAKQVEQALRRLANPRKAVFLQRFFRTGPGEYAEGDRLIGVTVPQTRRIVKKHRDLSRVETLKLLRSPIHELRLAALFILGEQFKHGSLRSRQKIYRDYLRNTRFINNWDLVDTSAPYIVGEYLRDRPRQALYKLARSKSLWERRIAMIACIAYIRSGDTRDGLKIAKLLLSDKHDLIHKAVGWMLREVGKQDRVVLERFLEQYARRMPRTMLRYAIEKFSPTQRRRYLRQV
ncbi:MAG: DNA alkylation repair protein [Parcubacteria group bacterium]